MNINTSIKLNNGIEMPIFGLGVWQSKDGPEVESAVENALEVGYRSIDTASIYLNERGVGNAIRNSAVPREEIFVTSKVWNNDQGYESTLRAIDKSLEKLKMDYVDLYLVHWPVKGKFRDTWKAMEKIYESGKSRAVGISNFLIHHLEDLLQSTELTPAVNQIEFHPHLIQRDLVNYCFEREIRIEAWSPIMKGRVNDNDTLVEISNRYNKTPAQVVLRWDIQQEIITIPKSSNASRIRENADIFDFQLEQSDMELINSLDRGHRYGPDPDNFNL